MGCDAKGTKELGQVTEQLVAILRRESSLDINADTTKLKSSSEDKNE